MEMVSVTEARAILTSLMYPERAALPERKKIAAEDDPSDAAAIIKYSDHIIYLFDGLIGRIEDE